MARAGFVHETPSEFLSSGDFNGDGNIDALVLDKATGNARIGYQGVDGGLSWSPPFTNGITGVTGVGIGRFIVTNRDAIAVTAPDFNRIALMNVPIPGSNSSPVVIHPGGVPPSGIGPRSLAGLAAPFGTNTPFDELLCVSSQNATPAERLNLLGLNAGAVVSSNTFAETARLERVNALPILSNVTFAVGMARGSNDALHVWRFTNSPASAFSSSNLPAGSEYTFGNFYLEPWPRFITYVPGESNLTVLALEDLDASPRFGTPQMFAFNQAIHGIFYTDIGTNGQLWIQFGDGILGARPPQSSGTIQSNFWLSAGSDRNTPSGIIGVGVNQAAFLYSVSNSGVTDFSKLLEFNGSTWSETESNALPTVTTRLTRANVWLFTSEPFVNLNAGFVGGVGAPDWSRGVSGLPGNLSVTVESDAGATNGLSGDATNNFGTPPVGAAFGTPNQYHPAISFFGYASATPPEPIIVTISPAPGVYGAPVKVTFTKQNAAHIVRYRLSASSDWLTYSSPFNLTNDTTVQFFGEYPTNNLRGRLQSASYVFGRTNLSPAPTLTLPGYETNPPPTLNTNVVLISPSGTVFYGRRGAGINSATLWAINLDGSGETYITTGLRPRVSRDGRYLSFLRENDPPPNQFSLWARDLATGAEVRLHSSSNQYVGHDWTADNTGIIFDNNCFFWRIGLTGGVTQLPLPTDCSHGAPSVNPLDGSLAFQTITPATHYLYLAPSNATTRQDILLSVDNPRWPAWSPDGERVVIANNVSLGVGISAGHDLFIVDLGAQTNVHQITALNPISNFPNGAVWTPNGNKLVGAGNINGVNGLWVIPLATDGSACHCPPQLLPTLPGDDIDFAGGVVAASVSVSYANLGLFIRAEANAIVVFWSTNYDGFVLESAHDLPADFSWTPVSGPYFRNGPWFEYHEARGALSLREYFRLAYPGVLVLTPTEPQLDFRLEPNAAVLKWPLNYVGYTLEAATNLSPPVFWLPLNGPYPNTNGLFEFIRPRTGGPQEFYRLRGP